MKVSKHSSSDRSGDNNLNNCIDGYSSSNSSRMSSSYSNSSSNTYCNSSGGSSSSSSSTSYNSLQSNNIIPCIVSHEAAVHSDIADCSYSRGNSWTSSPRGQKDTEIMEIGKKDSEINWVGSEKCIDALHTLRPKSSLSSTSFSAATGLSLHLLSDVPCSPVKEMYSHVRLQHREQEHTDNVDVIQRHNEKLSGHGHLLLDRESLLSEPSVYFDSRMMAMAMAYKSDANNYRNGKNLCILFPSLSSAQSPSANSRKAPSSPMTEETEDDSYFLTQTELSIAAPKSNRLRVLNSINSSNSLQLTFKRVSDDSGNSTGKNDGKYFDAEVKADDRISLRGLYDICICDSSAAHDSKYEGKSTDQRDDGNLKNFDCGFVNTYNGEGSLLQFILDSIARNVVQIIPQNQSSSTTLVASILSTSQLPASVIQWLRRQVQWVVWTMGALERRNPGESLNQSICTNFYN